MNLRIPRLAVFTLLAGVTALIACEETPSRPTTDATTATSAVDAVDAAEGVPSLAVIKKGVFWGLNGNESTNASNFLGTSDNQPLLFKTNGSEALRILANGNVGKRTTSPEGALHVASGGVPQLTVASTNASNFSVLRFRTPINSTFWDVFTSPSRLSISKSDFGTIHTVRSNGRVGIGTITPDAPLHVRVGSGGQLGFIVEEARAGLAAQMRLKNDAATWAIRSGAGNGVFSIKVLNAGVTAFAILPANGWVGLGTTTPGHPLEMASGAHVTVGGSWTMASSRTYKENIRDLTAEDAQSALKGLTPVRFNYKSEADEDYAGFIAEDVPALVATQDRKGLSSMDVVAVLTKIVQEQEDRIADLETRLNALD